MDVMIKDGKLQSNRIPSLDGWRGFSIILVILGHQILHGESFINTSRFSNYSNFLVWHLYGVQIFFVISGFLITSLLDKEFQITKDISLRNFYLRRIFRILPAYYFLLITIFILSRTIPDGETLNRTAWIKSLLFVSNFDFGTTSWSLGYTWSLSTEEQFYLFWPIIFCYPKLRKIIPVVFICAVPIFRMLNFRYHLFGEFAFWVKSDAIFIGAFFAMQKNTAWIQKYKFIIVGIAAALLLCEKLGVPYSGYITVPFSYTFFELAIICLIFHSFNPKTILYKVMNSKVLVFIGLISYSLYLWQQLLFPCSVIGNKVITYFPINVVLMVVLAYLTYRFIETPFLNLRKKIVSSS